MSIEPAAPDLPVGAYLASALADANIPCDSGEDVDRLIEQLAWRGFAVVRTRAIREQHEPGDAHRYGQLICEVCGQRGQVRVSIVPERAEPEYPDD